jgi:hypothetical protein
MMTMPTPVNRGLRATVVRYARLLRAQRAGTVEALLELVRAYVFVRILGWPRYSRSLGTPLPGNPVFTWDGDISEAVAICRAVDRWRRIAPSAATCLIRAIAAQRMLTRRDVPNALVLGVRIDPQRQEMTAHGWVRVGGHVVVGADEMTGYHPVAHFPRLTTGRDSEISPS